MSANFEKPTVNPTVEDCEKPAVSAPMDEPDVSSPMEDFEKLVGYREIKWSELHTGLHLRYSTRDYNDPTKRKLVYAVVHSMGFDECLLKSYKPKAEWNAAPWPIFKHSPRTYRFYVKNRQ